MREILADFQLAARRLRRSPGFVGAAVSSLALGVGAVTALFSVFYGVVLRPLPYPEPDRLVALWETKPAPGWERAHVSPADFFDWRRPGSPFEDITAYFEKPLLGNLAGLGEPRAVQTVAVFGNFFTVFRTPPLLGRLLREDESWPGPPPVVILSYRFWRDLGADSSIVGRSLLLDGRERTVAGVMPAAFQYPSPEVDLWLPIRWQPGQVSSPLFRAGHSLRPIGRLRPGVSLAQARGYLAAVDRRLERQFPESNQGLRPGLAPLRDWLVGPVAPALLTLFGSTLVLLLIACVNVANLQLVRGIGRSRETALRLALGCSRWHLLRPLLVEDLLLATLGTLAGLGLAAVGTRTLLGLAAGQIPRAEEVALQPTVLAVSVAGGISAALLSGLAPAFQWLRAGTSALRQGIGQGTVARGPGRFQHALVIAEIALAVLLLLQATLLLRSFVALVHTDPGFRSAGVLTARISLPPARYRGSRELASFWARLLEKVEAIPGVRRAGLTDGLPLTGLEGTVDLYREGRPEAEHGVDLSHRIVSPDYFRTLGVPLKSGRFFGREDSNPKGGSVLIDQAAAKLYFRGESAVGSRIAFEPPKGEATSWQTIVGVVGDERIEGLATAVRPEVFQPVAEVPQYSMSLVLRSSLPAARLLDPVRAELRKLDPTLALAEVQPLANVAAKTLLPERFLTLLAALFAGVALALAVVGVFGVMSRLVGQRTREIGIRLALGAPRRSVLVAILGRALALLAVGAGIGMAVAWVLPLVLVKLLFRVPDFDSATAVWVLLALLGAGLAAAYLPARRATQVQPASVLHEE